MWGTIQLPSLATTDRRLGAPEHPTDVWGTKPTKSPDVNAPVSVTTARAPDEITRALACFTRVSERPAVTRSTGDCSVKLVAEVPPVAAGAWHTRYVPEDNPDGNTMRPPEMTRRRDWPL